MNSFVVAYSGSEEVKVVREICWQIDEKDRKEGLS